MRVGVFLPGLQAAETMHTTTTRKPT